MPTLAVVGYASIDTITLPGRAPVETIGGGAVYAALSAARLGVGVTLHVAVGDDFPTAWIAQLGALGIDISAVARRPGPTRRVQLTYGADEQRLASAVRDAAWWERTHALAPPLPLRGYAGYLACPIPLDMVRQLSAIAAGGVFVADTSEAFAAAGAEALAAFAGVGIFAPSLDEIRLLSGEPDDALAIRRVAESVPILVAKLGREGLSRIDHHGTLHHPITPVEATDPTGAGDATVGGLAAAVLLGESPASQLAFAAKAGREVVGGIGPAALGWREG